MKKVAFLFPGQGAQYIGMGHDFFREFASARTIFEEADDLLKMNLSTLIFEGTKEELQQTNISQIALFTVSSALLTVLKEYTPFVALGLSLGEYSALYAGKKLSFEEALLLVRQRGLAMEKAAHRHKGTMAVILGLPDQAVIDICTATSPDVVAANFNCPNQVVISGSHEAVEKASKRCLEKGAKRVVSLDVSGAFHSPFMKEAEEDLKPLIELLHINKSPIHCISNVTGAFEDDEKVVKSLLLRQLTAPVLWHKSITTCEEAGVDLYIEIGPGKTLTGLNKRIHTHETLSLEHVEDLKVVEQRLI